MVNKNLNKLIMKTKLEVINETVEYYSQDVSRRAIRPDGYSCSYYTESGNMCGVGRCLEDPIAFKHSYSNASYLLDLYGFQILKEEYRIMDTLFWRDIQILHDYTPNWTKEGLSEIGKQRWEELKQKYA